MSDTNPFLYSGLLSEKMAISNVRLSDKNTDMMDMTAENSQHKSEAQPHCCTVLQSVEQCCTVLFQCCNLSCSVVLVLNHRCKTGRLLTWSDPSCAQLGAGRRAVNTSTTCALCSSAVRRNIEIERF